AAAVGSAPSRLLRQSCGLSPRRRTPAKKAAGQPTDQRPYHTAQSSAGPLPGPTPRQVGDRAVEQDSDRPTPQPKERAAEHAGGYHNRSQRAEVEAAVLASARVAEPAHGLIAGRQAHATKYADQEGGESQVTSSEPTGHCPGHAAHEKPEDSGCDGG